MSCKDLKRKKHIHKEKKHRNLKDNKSMSKEDIDELELLRLQLAAIQIYFCSDIFFYVATIKSFEFLDYDFESIKDSEEVKTMGIEYINEYLISSALYGLISRITLGIVDFTRYSELEERYKKGEINYSLTPNIFINLFDMLNIIAYSYILIGYFGLYEEDIFKFVQVFNKDYTKVLLSIQEQAIAIRILGTCSLYESTLISMEVIYDKYNKKPERHRKMPVESALEASECYLTARIMIEDLNFQLFNEVVNNGEDIEVVEAYRSLWEGNVYGVIGNFQGLAGILGLRERNLNQPIFGI